MMKSTISEAISQYLGSSPKPYLVPYQDKLSETGCEYWELPPQKEEDKSTLLRYQEIISQIIQLSKENKDDPKIKILAQQVNELLNDVPVTKKYGIALVSENDILGFDKMKGIRKEWWELQSRFFNQGVCVFQGYKNGAVSTLADKLIVMPNPDQYEFLRINQTRGNNHPVETEQIIIALRKLENLFGISVIFASSDFVEFIFNKSINAESIAGIRQRLRRLCPSAEELTSGIRSGRVTLWWD